MSDGTTTALLHVALAALAVGLVLQVIGAVKGLRAHGAGKVGLFHPTIRPWTLASLGAISVSVLCCLPIVWS
ncbi:hypothetical protein [Clavibacter sp. km1a]|uniref:hypothetical protein n=1 Tax=Clavibacter sp. km1a TaxID=3459136 RepID=UPI004041FEDD